MTTVPNRGASAPAVGAGTSTAPADKSGGFRSVFDGRSTIGWHAVPRVLKIAELNTATIDVPDYNADAILAALGSRGHIALGVHDNDDLFGDARWGPGAQCRWRNIRIKTLDHSKENNQ